ncbi:hypothetical protein ACRWOO_20850 [Streptomyces sp. NEAU-PBA10]|uniref:hypothetical protein n=1 Tax=Streptomyces sp. NEAU-PBA10 TaxID=3438640 RepID=UPI003F7AB9B7
MSTAPLRPADSGEAADLAAFLRRLVHYDKAAAVRLQLTGERLAVFGRPASFEVLAVRTVLLDDAPAELDRTVSAGELLELVHAESEPGAPFGVPEAVTGPPWAGVLPPRTGWRAEPGLPAPDAIRAAVAAVVAEFRTRTEALAPEERTRTALDAIGHEIWSRPLGDTALPVRAAHAAHAMGFLRPAPVRVPAASVPGDGGAPAEPFALRSAGAWLRLRTPCGSVAVRRAGLGAFGVSVR